MIMYLNLLLFLYCVSILYIVLFLVIILNFKSSQHYFTLWKNFMLLMEIWRGGNQYTKQIKKPAANLLELLKLLIICINIVTKQTSTLNPKY